MVFRLRIAVAHEINPAHLGFSHTRCWVTAFARRYGSEDELAAVVRTYANPASRYLWTLLQPGLQAVALGLKICDIPTVYNGRYNI